MISIREATKNDASAIAYVHICSWRENYAGLVPTSYLMNLSYNQQSKIWFDALSKPTSLNITYVAVNERGHIVGFASAGITGSVQTQDNCGELYGVHLLKGYQQCGIGQQLVYNVVDHLLDLQINAMKTWVVVDHYARGFYGANGGEVVDNRAVSIAQIEVWEVCYAWFDLQDFGIPVEVLQPYHELELAG